METKLRKQLVQELSEEGLTVEEIAEGLGMTPQAVRMYRTDKSHIGKEYGTPSDLFFCKPIGHPGRGVILPLEVLIRYLENCQTKKNKE